jgi:hypothetical protein
LNHLQTQTIDVQVQVASGEVLHCDRILKHVPWAVNDCTFTTDMKVLPLGHFDFILGMDWLEVFSPMKVHWKHKWLALPYQGATAILQGITLAIPEEIIVHICSIVDPTPLPADSVRPEVAVILEEFAMVFQPLSQLPPERACDHFIPLIPGAKPVHIRPYKYPPSLKDEIEKQVADMLHKGIIQPSTSAFSSPILLVRKKDGSWRFCIDYRYLNAMTLKSKLPIPMFDELMDELAKAKWFSSLDLNSGYHQIGLKKGEAYKTTFQTHFGLFEFNVMTFGLCGAPGTFQGAMNCTLAPLLRKCVLVFFDDILVYSATFSEHLEHLRKVLQLLAHDKWQVKLSKCNFARQQLSYLGHIISAKGIATNPSKITTVQSWPPPTNVKELRSFLGLTGYYRKFVKHFAVIAKPLTDLLKKQALLVWTSEHTEAFNTLKLALVSAPVLAMLDFSQTFCIEIDASNKGVGAVLLQNGHPLAFISKPLGPRTHGLSTYEKEYLAIC